MGLHKTLRIVLKFSNKIKSKQGKKFPELPLKTLRYVLKVIFRNY
jgi:hypothetical protein